MKFEMFQEKYAAAFGSKLTERNGLTEWGDWIGDEKRNDGLIVKVLHFFADEYNSAIAAMSPNAKNLVPTLEGFKAKYFAIIRESRPASAQRSDCQICGGRGLVFVLAPLASDRLRKFWPPDYRRIDPDQYIGVELTPCPVCHSDRYPEFELRKRVEYNSLPERVAIDHPARIPGYCDRSVIWGDALLKEYVERAARKKHPTLEEAFPI